MKKIMISILLACVLIFTFLPLAASAVTGAVDDYNGGSEQSINLDEEELLAAEALRVSRACDLDIALFFASSTYASAKSFDQYATEFYQNHKKLGADGLVLAIDRKNEIWTILAFGRAQERLTAEVKAALYKAYDDEDTYYGGGMAYFKAAEQLFAKTYSGAVDDFRGKISAGNLEILREAAAEASASCEMDVAFLIPPEDFTGTLHEYAADYYAQKKLGKDGFVLALDLGKTWGIKAFGAAENRISDEMEDRLYKAYDTAETYSEGVQNFLALAGRILAASGADLSRVPEGERLPRFTDDMGLLTEEQAQQLLAKLDEISERQQFDVVVAVVPALDKREARLYAADFMEANGFGYNGTEDRTILLLATADRDFGFAAQGYGLTVFTVPGQEYLDKLFLPDMKADRYFEAFMAFADGVDDFITKANEGTPYDEGNIPKTRSEMITSHVMNVIFSLLIGLLIAWFVTKRWKKQLQSVAKQADAAHYVRPGSLVITGQQDAYISSSTTSVRRVSDDSGSGRSSSGGGSFSSSSGSSSTGHSGKY